MPETTLNWRDYIKILDLELNKSAFAFDSNTHLLIEKALDDIAATGEDGQELIRMAFRNNPFHGNKVTILPASFMQDAAQKISPSTKASSCRAAIGYISLDTNAIASLYYHTKEGDKHPSLTGVLVHELFHLADFNQRSDVFDYNLRIGSVVSKTLTLEQKEEVFKAYAKIWDEIWQSTSAKNPPPTESEYDAVQAAAAKAKNSEYKPPNELYREKIRRLSFEELERNAPAILQQMAEKAGVPVGSFTFLPLKDIHYFERPQKQAIDEKLNDPVEQDATRFTDAFMAKHFPLEPMRGTYAQGYISKKKGPLFDQAPGCGNISNIYEPKEICLGSLGEFNQPRISEIVDKACIEKGPKRKFPTVSL
jgi:hypothetical protein